MKIKLQFEFKKYEDSKFATFLSMVKSGIGGFFAWVGIFILPLLVSCGISSQYGVAGIAAGIIGGLCIISYGLLFFIDESKLSKKAKRIQKEANNQNVSLNDSLNNLREEKINKLLENTLQELENINLKSIFYKIRNQVINSINNDFLFYEQMYGKLLYTENNIEIIDVLQRLETKLFCYSIYYIFDLNIEFANVRTGSILEKIDEIFNNNINNTNNKFKNLSLDKQKEYILKELYDLLK